MATSLLSIDDLTNEEILQLFQLANHIQKQPRNFAEYCRHRILALLFFEASTRTYYSFNSAMYRLGGQVLGFADSRNTSTSKGETLEDTAKMMSFYADMLVVRHPELGSMQRIAQNVDVPVINAGEGTGEHPTQTLIDLYTIYQHFGKLDVHIALFGDLQYGRTTHSLLLAGARFGAQFTCIAPQALQMPESYRQQAKRLGCSIHIKHNLSDALDNTDVLYVTRLQRERLPAELQLTTTPATLIVNQSVIEQLPTRSIVLHPLPRTEEIDPHIDSDTRAHYHIQAQNGVWIRMALILYYFADLREKIAAFI